MSLNIDENNNVVYSTKRNNLQGNKFISSSSFRAKVNVITFAVASNYWTCLVDKT